MVRAIIRGDKTKTRRVVNPQPDAFIRGIAGTVGVPKKITTKKPHANGSIWEAADGTCYDDIKCPYGNVGDRLWVRETFAEQNDTHGTGLPHAYFYKANSEMRFADTLQKMNDFGVAYDRIKWKPSLFMPREASRILLEITDIRVERLNDISEDDAIAEGVEKGRDRYLDYFAKKNYSTQFVFCLSTALQSFKSLWRSINGIRSWEENPYVWVISFKVIEINT
jgi:hypothetical protein